MKIYHIPHKLKAKPRGQLGKFGNMTHSLNGYREWQSSMHNMLVKINFSMPVNLYGIVIVFHIPKLKGHPFDCGNLQGGIEDVLVKYKYIRDDNWKVLGNYAGIPLKSEYPAYTIIPVENRKEFLSALNHYLPD